MLHERWTSDDDEILTQNIISEVSKGGTHKRAFEKTAQQLGRTPRACAYRWSTVTRKKNLERAREAVAEGVRKRYGEKKVKSKQVGYNIRVYKNELLALAEVLNESGRKELRGLASEINNFIYHRRLE